ncbi:MAG: hypothetical protein CME59_09160 [Halioglobus sp.]|nr:hypothetical protein [Halioglobus sp.]|tara:strand:+ start:1086 stop:1970 length:885 start_codon:yes stop_codon:yes gene_type:complete
MHQSLLSWQRFRYLYWALLLAAVSILLYVSQGLDASQPPNGGTWQGYTLGTIGALLIAWLSVLGIRKRRYSSNLGSVQGWASAHVYLGIALLLVATLHCAAQFGANVHTLAYVLMCLVIGTGIYGLYVYLHLPGRLAENHAGRDRQAWLAELAEVDDGIRDTVQRCDANLQAMALSALELTRLGGSALAQLLGRDRCRIRVESSGSVSTTRNPEQQVIIDELAGRIPNASKQAEAEVLNDLLALFGRRQVILHLLRRDIQYRALLKIWLYFHVPLTVALLVALAIHIFSVFVYW